MARLINPLFGARVIERLFQKYRIDLGEKRKPKVLATQDLEVVAYMFLRGEDFKDITLENYNHLNSKKRQHNQ